MKIKKKLNKFFKFNEKFLSSHIGMNVNFIKSLYDVHIIYTTFHIIFTDVNINEE